MSFYARPFETIHFDIFYYYYYLVFVFIRLHICFIHICFTILRFNGIVRHAGSLEPNRHFYCIQNSFHLKWPLSVQGMLAKIMKNYVTEYAKSPSDT